MDRLAVLLGSLLSLIFSFFPGLDVWYDSLGKNSKRVLMAGALAVVTVASFGLVCVEVIDNLAIVCTRVGWYGLLWAFVSAIAANQATHRLTPRTIRDTVSDGSADNLATIIGVCFFVVSALVAIALFVWVVPSGV